MATCCLPVTAGIAVGVGLGQLRFSRPREAEADPRAPSGDRSRGIRRVDFSPDGTHASTNKSPADEAQALPPKLQSRVDSLQRVLEAAVEERQAAPEKQLLPAAPPPPDFHADLAEERTRKLEERLARLEVPSLRRGPLEAGEPALERLQAQVLELQRRVDDIGQERDDLQRQLEVKDHEVQALEALAEQHRIRAEGYSLSAGAEEAREEELRNYQELVQQMRTTAELREEQVNMLTDQLRQAEAEVLELQGRVQSQERQEQVPLGQPAVDQPDEQLLQELSQCAEEAEEAEVRLQHLTRLLEQRTGEVDQHQQELLQRAQEAEGRQQHLERLLEDRTSEVDEHKQALGRTTSEHQLLVVRVSELESAVEQKDEQLRQLQELVAQVEAKAASQENDVTLSLPVESKFGDSPCSLDGTSPRTAEQRKSTGKLKHFELQALQTRLAMSESRLKQEEGKSKNLEWELLALQREKTRTNSPALQSREADREELRQQELAHRQALQAELEEVRQQRLADKQSFDAKLEAAVASAKSSRDTSGREAAIQQLKDENARLKTELARVLTRTDAQAQGFDVEREASAVSVQAPTLMVATVASSRTGSSVTMPAGVEPLLLPQIGTPRVSAPATPAIGVVHGPDIRASTALSRLLAPPPPASTGTSPTPRAARLQFGIRQVGVQSAKALGSPASPTSGSRQLGQHRGPMPLASRSTPLQAEPLSRSPERRVVAMEPMAKASAAAEPSLVNQLSKSLPTGVLNRSGSPPGPPLSVPVLSSKGIQFRR